MQDQQNIENNQFKQQAVVTAISNDYKTNPNVMKCLIEEEDQDDCGYQIGAVKSMMQDKNQHIHYNPNKQSPSYFNNYSQSKLAQSRDPHFNFSFDQSNHSDQLLSQIEKENSQLLVDDHQMINIEINKINSLSEIDIKKQKEVTQKGTQQKQIFIYNDRKVENEQAQQNTNFQSNLLTKNSCQESFSSNLDNINMANQSSSQKILKNYFYNSSSQNSLQKYNTNIDRNESKNNLDNQQIFESRRSVEGRRGRSHRRKSNTKTKNQEKSLSSNDQISKENKNKSSNSEQSVFIQTINFSAKSKQKELVNMSNKKIYDMISQNQIAEMALNFKESNKKFNQIVNSQQLIDCQSDTQNYQSHKIQNSKAEVQYSNLNYQTQYNQIQNAVNQTQIEKQNDSLQNELNTSNLFEQKPEKLKSEQSENSEKTTFQYTNIQEPSLIVNKNSSLSNISKSKCSYSPSEIKFQSSNTLLNQKQDDFQVFSLQNQQEQTIFKKQMQTKSQGNALTNQLQNTKQLYYQTGQTKEYLDNQLEDIKFQRLSEIDHGQHQSEIFAQQELQNFNTSQNKHIQYKNEIKTPQIIKLQNKSFSSLSKQKPYQSTKMFLLEQQEKIKRVQEESMILSPNGHNRAKGKKETMLTTRVINQQKQEDEKKETTSNCMMTERVRRDYLNHTITTSRKLNSQMKTKNTNKVNSRQVSSNANDLIEKSKNQKLQSKIEYSKILNKIQSSTKLNTYRHNRNCTQQFQNLKNVMSQNEVSNQQDNSGNISKLEQRSIKKDYLNKQQLSSSKFAPILSDRKHINDINQHELKKEQIISSGKKINFLSTQNNQQNELSQNILEKSQNEKYIKQCISTSYFTPDNQQQLRIVKNVKEAQQKQFINDKIHINQMGPKDYIKNEDATSNKDQMITPRSKFFQNKSEMKVYKKDEQEMNSDMNQSSQYMIRTVSSQKLPCEFSTTKQIKQDEQQELQMNESSVFQEYQQSNREMINKNLSKINKVSAQSSKKISQFNSNKKVQKQLISPFKLVESHSQIFSKGEYCQNQINITAQKYKDSQMYNNQYQQLNKIQSSFCLSEKKQDSVRYMLNEKIVFNKNIINLNENSQQIKMSSKKYSQNQLSNSPQNLQNIIKNQELVYEINQISKIQQDDQKLQNIKSLYCQQTMKEKKNFETALNNINMQNSKIISQNELEQSKRSYNESETEISQRLKVKQENDSEKRRRQIEQQKQSVERLSSCNQKNLNKYVNQSHNRQRQNQSKTHNYNNYVYFKQANEHKKQGIKSVIANEPAKILNNELIDDRQNQVNDCYVSNCSTNRLRSSCAFTKKSQIEHNKSNFNKMNSSILDANEIQPNIFKNEEIKQTQLKNLQGLNDGMRKSRSKMGNHAPVLQNVSHQNVSNHLTSYNSLFSNTRRSVQNSSKINVQSQVKIGYKNGQLSSKNNQSKVRKDLNQSVQEKLKRPNEIAGDIKSNLKQDLDKKKLFGNIDDVEIQQKSNRSVNSDEIRKQSYENSSLSKIYSIKNYKNYEQQVSNLKQNQNNEITQIGNQQSQNQIKQQQNKMDYKSKEGILKEVMNQACQNHSNNQLSKRPTYQKEEPNKPMTNNKIHLMQKQKEYSKGVQKNINQIINNHIQLQIQDNQIYQKACNQEDLVDDDFQNDSYDPYKVNALIKDKDQRRNQDILNPVAYNNSLDMQARTMIKDENKYGNIVGVLKTKGDKDNHHNQSVMSQDDHIKHDQRFQKRVNAPQIIIASLTGLESERNKNPHFSYVQSKNKNSSTVRSQINQVQSSHIYQINQKTPITRLIGQSIKQNQVQGMNLNNTMSYGAQQQQQAVKEKKQKFYDILQPQEKEKFGDRTPLGFKKLGLLGKGGIALVWHAEIKDAERYGYNQQMKGQKVALKQFPKIKGQSSIDNSAKIEIEIGNTLFPLRLKDGFDGSQDSDFERASDIDCNRFPGIKSIAKLIDQIEDSKDVWLVYEVGEQCLGKHLCEVKGEFYKGERIYKIQHLLFYQIMANDIQILRSFIIKMSEIFDVLAQYGIVHSDIKPDNILIQMNENQSDIQEIKLIDFGSAFQFHNVTQITATTPEYLAPEILDYLEQRSKNQKSDIASALNLSKKSWPWSFDVWSLGIILLEIASGCPVWMSLKCRMSTVDGKSVIGSGLLGVQGREQKRIIQKQQQILKSIPQTLKKFECYGLEKNMLFMDLLNRMLCSDPAKRISPQEIIQHPFCSV